MIQIKPFIKPICEESMNSRNNNSNKHVHSINIYEKNTNENFVKNSNTITNKFHNNEKSNLPYKLDNGLNLNQGSNQQSKLFSSEPSDKIQMFSIRYNLV